VNSLGLASPRLHVPPFPKSEIEQSIITRFAQQVTRYPDRLAVRSTDLRLTYRQLDERSNWVARRIMDTTGADGRPNQPIGLFIDQGAAAVVAILGILKAGGIYVALDPALPDADLALIMSDCRPSLLVTDRANRGRAFGLHNVPAGCIVLEGGETAQSVGLPLAPDSLAYIYYTSGTTGPPKGVCDSHRNVLHNIMRYTNSLRIGPADRLSLIQSRAFSGTVSSLFGALLNGAAIFPFDLRSRGIESLADWLADEKMTMLHCVPMIFERLLETEKAFPDLRLIRLEGDRALAHHITAFQRRFGPACVLVNGLGATETGIVAQFFVTGTTTLEGDGVPVGRPVEDMEVLLLDHTGQSVAKGSVGEIAVNSRYLATGYWNRPDLTKRAFCGDTAGPGKRLYRTGDMGRMLPGDCLDILGRRDFRAKLRGQTIDISKIEAALRAIHPVNQALVCVREDRPGRPRLTAYIVTAPGERTTVTYLRRAAAVALPEFMIPAQFIFLDTLPLDRHFKVRRCGLPVPGSDRPLLGCAYAPPGDDRQQQLTSCFEEVLAIAPIGVDDDFFDLGGDSLSATDLMLLIEEKLGVACRRMAPGRHCSALPDIPVWR
jgi:amino acid adenylation domain-containing protein